MSDPRDDSPPRAAPLIWRTLGLSAAGAVTLVWLVLSGHAAPGPALAGAAALAALGVVLAATDGRDRRRRAATPPPPREPAADTPSLPYATMLEHLGDPILLIQGGAQDDPSERRFVFANGAARALLRIQRPEGPLATAIRDPEVLDAVEEALFRGEPAEAVYEIRGVQDRLWRARAAPLVPQSPGAPRALLTLRDETEIRRSERTRADFLANASHELRTPLASLTGFIETLRGHARDDAEARDRFLGIMQGQAERMRRLIDDLMSLSRIELAEHIPPSGEVDLAVAVVDVLDALTPLAREHDITLAPHLPARGAALAAADRDQILQVIQNLAENALKYSPDGARVEIDVLAGLSHAEAAAPASDLAAHFSILTPDRAADRRYAAVRVRDFGPGIARAHLPRLTERFYRVEGQKAREKPGTGLGLAIVKHIVNRHRGGLIVESTPGAGTLFNVYIPMAEAAGTPLASDVPPVAA